MDQRFAQALIQAAQQSSPALGGSPNQTAANAGQMANLQNLAQISMKSGASSAAMRPAAADVGMVADREAAEREAAAKVAALQAEQAEARRKEEYQAFLDQQDPKNYKQEVSDDGGYNFYNAAGEPISVGEYAKATNKRISDVLKDSQSSTDQDFNNDYKDTMQLGRIMSSGSKEELDKFYKDKPGLQEYMKENDIKTFAQYVDRFRGAYSDKFSQPEADSQKARPATSSFNVRGETPFKWPWER